MEDRVIVDSRFLLKGRADSCRDSVRAVSTDKDAQIGHSEGLERIKLSLEAGTISSHTLASKDGSIPEIGSDIV